MRRPSVSECDNARLRIVGGCAGLILAVLLSGSVLWAGASSLTPPTSRSLASRPPASRPLAQMTPATGPPPAADPFAADLPVGPVTYVVPLTVRHVTETSATLFFRLSVPAAGNLFYRPAGADGQAFDPVALLPQETAQAITLDGLTPGVTYQAVVVLSAGDGSDRKPAFMGQDWGPVSFRTAAGAGEPLRIGVIGDASFGDPATVALVEQMAAYDLDFVIHVGDVVDETNPNADPVESYARKFFAPFAPLLHRMPVYTVIGNHDYEADLRWQGAPFYDFAFPPPVDPRFTPPVSPERCRFYAFARGDIQFVMLDSQVFFGVSGRAEQNAWLRERLSDPRFDLTIPVLHVSPYSSGAVHPRDGLPVRTEWSPLFAEAGVPVVFSGHSHLYERLLVDGVTYIVSGGGSATLYAVGEILPESQVVARRTHFVLMEIEADRIQLTAIALGGEVIDQVSIARG